MRCSQLVVEVRTTSGVALGRGPVRGEGENLFWIMHPTIPSWVRYPKEKKGSIPRPLADNFFENLTKYKYKARL